MRYALSLMALALLSGDATAAQVTYTFVDLDQDETFEVYALVDGDELTGLATFNIVLSGLDATPIDPETIVYTPVLSELANINTAFLATGFHGVLMEGAIDIDEYRVVDSQVDAPNPIFGFAAIDTFVDAAIIGLFTSTSMERSWISASGPLAPCSES